MKKIILILNIILILFAINFSIFKKEETIKHGQTMLLKLAPIDPRSLMQGDYMVLNYAFSRQWFFDEALATNQDQIPQNIQEKMPKNGKIIVGLDQNKVAKFVDLYSNQKLAKNQFLLNYKKNNNSNIQFGAESFFFQEGDADLYANAKYGELKVDEKGKSVLIGLRDENLKVLGHQNHD